MERFLIYGCGKKSTYFIEKKFIDLMKVSGFIDNYYDGSDFYGRQVLRLDDLSDVIVNDTDIVLVTTYDFEMNKKIYVDLRNAGFSDKAIVFIYNKRVDFTIDAVHEQDDCIIRENFPMIYETAVCTREQKLCIRRNLYDAIDNSNLVAGETSLKFYEEYMQDYSRYRTFEFVADEITERQVKGECAELGVYKGAFSALINRKLPSKKLYMFDTFTGFDDDEYSREIKAGMSPMGVDFSDTTEDEVLSAMAFPEKCEIRKGLFPHSLREDDMNESYAFVSLDVDLEESMYEGLKFFYPRLVMGGYIFVHDYHNYTYFGIKRAVKRYEEDYSIALKKVPLSDEGGTLVITK